MKIKHPEDGDIKIKRKFLLIPCGFDNETRWLEWATVKYRYDKSDPFTIGWFPVEFLDSNKQRSVLYENKSIFRLVFKIRNRFIHNSSK